ncbi:CalY family protein [Rossellomorea marisflavi]|uniref:CalY family protein n=1 Tax=Rossellomorea marisflavi TaxID=189381 RepID=UPI00279BBE11|nr:CalY family protein [Rossellomorea marisflavi]UTE73501.1 CalY family protein [Rossellomorea marisflavi]
MSIKKKLGLGVATAALGLSLIGGGTYAAFNDTATVNNHFASGTLDLAVKGGKNKPVNFDLSNMKPGDSVERIFKLKNVGTIAIKDVLMNVRAEEFDNGDNGSTMEDYLKQFKIKVFKVDQDPEGYTYGRESILESKDVTLYDLYTGDLDGKVKEEYLKENRINLAPIGSNHTNQGLVSESDNSVKIEIAFKNDKKKKENGEYEQNQFMNNSIDFFFDLEATQWKGIKIEKDDANGEINNGKQVQDSRLPRDNTSGSGKIDNPVTD